MPAYISRHLAVLPAQYISVKGAQIKSPCVHTVSRTSLTILLLPCGWAECISYGSVDDELLPPLPLPAAIVAATAGEAEAEVGSGDSSTLCHRLGTWSGE